MSGVQIGICQNSSCASQGALALVRDIEELAQGRCAVEEMGCLGKCGKGPNLQVKQRTGAFKVVEGVKSYKKALEVVTGKAELEVPDALSKVAKVKYDIRREGDAKAKMEKLDKAFKMIGGESGAAKTNPRGLSELLVMRSKELLRDHIDRSLQDAQAAVSLAGDWAQAQLALANALEMSGRAAEGANALKNALDINKGINKAAVKRQMNRMERKAKEQADQPQEAAPAPAPVAASEPPVAAPEPPASEASKQKAPGAKAAAKKKAVSKKKAPSGHGTKAAKKHVDDTDKQAAKQVEEKVSKIEEPSAAEAIVEGSLEDFVEWRLEETSRLNHNCIKMVLKSTNLALTSRHPITEVWHVDFLLEKDFGEELKRAYTPVSNQEAYRSGMMEFMIKVYTDGQMTPYLQRLEAGSTILVSPPSPTLNVEDYDDTVMVAGGSAVTVAYQACHAFLLHKPSASVQLALCNTTAEDVLYQDLFDLLLQKYPSFRMTHFISSGDMSKSAQRAAEQGVAGMQQGRITGETAFGGAPADCKGIVSGPSGLCQAALNMWAAQSRDPARLNILDELPAVPEPPEVEDTDQRLPRASSKPLDYPEPEALTIKPNSLEEQAGGMMTAREETSASKASLFCSLLGPFFLCQGRRLDQDDGEGIPDIGIAPA